MRREIVTIMVAMFTLLLVGQLEAGMVNVQGAGVTDDAYVNSNNTGTNYNGGSYRLKSYTTYETCWAVVRFDLPTLNPGEYISDATITFDYFANDNSTSGTATVTLHRLLYSWDETEVTWNERSSGTSWEPSPGGNIGWQDGSDPPENYSDTVLDSLDLVVGNYGLVTYQSTALTSVLDDMAQGTLDNNGFLLNTGRTYGTVNNGWYLASSDRADQVKPLLTLTIVPEPVTAMLFSFGAAIILRKKK